MAMRSQQETTTKNTLKIEVTKLDENRHYILIKHGVAMRVLKNEDGTTATFNDREKARRKAQNWIEETGGLH